MTPATPQLGVPRLLWELLTGQRTVEGSGPLLRMFQALPPGWRDAVRWGLRPKRRFLYGRLRALAHDRVLSGPFAGMPLAGSPAAPELLGTYECELAGVVEELSAAPFERVINIGARHGYYAVGLARMMPSARVHAFEADASARAALAANVALNGAAGRVAIAGECDHAALAASLGSGARALVVCDVDGGELYLLDPAAVTALARVTILVECHSHVEPPTEPVMAARFARTHDVRRFPSETRVLAHLAPGIAEPWRSRMPATLEALVQEHRRTPQSWLLLTPR